MTVQASEHEVRHRCIYTAGALAMLSSRCTPQCRGCAPSDYEEFLRFYSDGDEQLAEAFAVYDLDGDGFITSEELRKVLVGMGFGYCDNEQFCKLIIQSADANSDGKIDFAEFCHMMIVRLTLREEGLKEHQIFQHIKSKNYSS
ncbi:hypothetical protein KP509_35G042600 [Ceratopteris richardii]|uniref:EF-hand domain-containing protein n=1 Tax=Ceratopteris richardii TaxID=49495 RepID=A0A8T2QET9_CERRI|nr:hypothetical protein KP509_35G042600 [Ceratopteris richardii]